MAERSGICCSGNWIVDRVKTVDVWPQEETLANILDEESGTGGAACNVAIDLSRFQLGLELSGLDWWGRMPMAGESCPIAQRPGSTPAFFALSRMSLQPTPMS